MKSFYRISASVLLAAASAFNGLVLAESSRPEKTQLTVDSFSYSISPREVKNIFFLDATRGWMTIVDHSNETGYILKTQDGGNTWHKFTTPSQISHIFFISASHGWALRFLSDPKSKETAVYLMVTKDGGEHWERTSDKPVAISTRQNHQIVTSMAFIDRSRGWLVGEGSAGKGFVLETLNGGQSFRTPDGLPQGLTGCVGVYARTGLGVLILGSEYVLISADNGKTWKSAVAPETLGISPQLFDMSSAAFLKDGRGWLVGQGYRGSGTILSTTDFGRSWRLEFAAEGASNFKGIWTTDDKRRCAVGYSSLLFCTADDGISWSSREVLPARVRDQSNYFRNLVLLPSGRGWVMRYGGYLYRTADGGQTWLEADPVQ
jgi:photosystem II stability/assembly factor-like uncharacterized protein